MVAARSLGEILAIDGGDTVAVRLRGADGGEIVLLLPRPVAGELGARLVRVAAPTPAYGEAG